MAKTRKSWIESSRQDWGTFLDTDQTLTLEHLQTGCLMRIAAATEAMANNYNAIINERDMYKRWYSEKKQQIEKLEAKLKTKKGVATRYKNERDKLRAELAAIKTDSFAGMPGYKGAE